MKSKGQRDVCGSVSEFVLAQDAKAPGCASHEREREILLTITKGLKVGKYNALSGDTAPGCTGSSIDGEYSTPTLRLAVLSSALRGT